KIKYDVGVNWLVARASGCTVLGITGRGQYTLLEGWDRVKAILSGGQTRSPAPPPLPPVQPPAPPPLVQQAGVLAGRSHSMAFFVVAGLVVGVALLAQRD